MYKPSPQAMQKIMLVKPQGDNYETQNQSGTQPQTSDEESPTSSGHRNSLSPKRPASTQSSASSSMGPAGLFAEKRDAKPMPMNARRTVPLPTFTNRKEKKPRSGTMLRRTGSKNSHFSTDDVISKDARSFDTMPSLEEGPEPNQQPAPVSSVVVAKKGRESPLTNFSDDDLSSTNKNKEILKQHQEKMDELEKRMQQQIQDQERKNSELQQALLEQQRVIQQTPNQSNRSTIAVPPTMSSMPSFQHPQQSYGTMGQAYGQQQRPQVMESKPQFQSQMMRPQAARAPPQQQQQQQPPPAQGPPAQYRGQQQAPPQQQYQGQPPAQQQPPLVQGQAQRQQYGAPQVQQQPGQMQQVPPQQQNRGQQQAPPQQQHQGQPPAQQPPLVQGQAQYGANQPPPQQPRQMQQVPPQQQNYQQGAARPGGFQPQMQQQPAQMQQRPQQQYPPSGPNTPQRPQAAPTQQPSPGQNISNTNQAPGQAVPGQFPQQRPSAAGQQNQLAVPQAAQQGYNNYQVPLPAAAQGQNAQQRPSAAGQLAIPQGAPQQGYNNNRVPTPQAQQQYRQGYPPQQQPPQKQQQQYPSGQTRLPPNQQQSAQANGRLTPAAQAAALLGMNTVQASSGQSRNPGDPQRAMTPLSQVAPQRAMTPLSLGSQNPILLQQQANNAYVYQQQQQQPAPAGGRTPQMQPTQQQQYRVQPPQQQQPSVSPAPSNASQGFSQQATPSSIALQTQPSTQQVQGQRARTASHDSSYSALSGVSSFSQNLPQFTPERRQGGYPGQVLESQSVAETPPSSTKDATTPNTHQGMQSPQWLTGLATQTVQSQHKPAPASIPQTAAPEQTEWLSQLTTQTVQQQQQGVQAQAQQAPAANIPPAPEQTEWLATLATQTTRQPQATPPNPPQEQFPVAQPPIDKRPPEAAQPIADGGDNRARALDNLWSQAETNHAAMAVPAVATQAAQGAHQDSATPETPKAETPKPQKGVAQFKKGQELFYKNAKGVTKATVLKVHFDDQLEPYYTVSVDGREKQTDDAHLFLQNPLQQQSDHRSSNSSFQMPEHSERTNTSMFSAATQPHSNSMTAPQPSNAPPAYLSQPQTQSAPPQMNSHHYQANGGPPLQPVFSGDSNVTNEFEGHAPLGSGGTPWGSAPPPSSAPTQRMDQHGQHHYGTPMNQMQGYPQSSGNMMSRPPAHQQVGAQPESPPHWQTAAPTERNSYVPRPSENGAGAAVALAALNRNSAARSSATTASAQNNSSVAAGSGNSKASGGTRNRNSKNGSSNAGTSRATAGAQAGATQAAVAGQGGSGDSRSKSPNYGSYCVCFLLFLLLAGGATAAALYFFTDIFGNSSSSDTPAPTAITVSPSPSIESTAPSLESTEETTPETTPIPAPSTTNATFAAPPSSTLPPLMNNSDAQAPSFADLPGEDNADFVPNSTLPQSTDDDLDFFAIGNFTAEFPDDAMVDEAENSTMVPSAAPTMGPTKAPITAIEIIWEEDTVAPSNFTENPTEAPVIVEPSDATTTLENDDWPANRTAQTFVWQEAGSITGTARRAQIGSFLSSNSDGTSLVFGSPPEANRPVLVYKINGNRAMGVPLPQFVDNANPVSAIINGEGTIVAVGYNDGSVQAFRFKETGAAGSGVGEWEKRGNEIRPEGERINAISTAVAMSATNGVLVVAVLNGDTGSLSVQPYLYSSRLESWELVGSEIREEGRQREATVQLSANGIFMAYTSLYDDSDGAPVGSVKTFELDIYGGANATTNPRGSVTLENITGVSVSFDVNGNTMAVCTEKETNVYGFDWSNRAWDVQPGGTFPGGDIVSLSYSGRVMAIGGENMVDTYELIGNLWMRHPSRRRLTLEGEAKDDEFGSSVAISGDAKKLAVGAPGGGGGRANGAVYRYDAEANSYWET